MMRRAWLLAVALAGYALVGGPLPPGGTWAQTGGPPPPASDQAAPTESLGGALDALGRDNPVLARVDGHEIRFADVAASAGDLPDTYRGRIEAVLPALLGRLIDQRLLVQAGRAAGLAADPTVRRKVAEFEDRAIGEAYVEAAVGDAVSAEALGQRYDQYVREVEARTEVRARHILLSSREAALAIIAELDEGADFATLARERSIAPSAAAGGDVDYFRRDSMAPEFAEMAFALQVGEYAKAPLHTAYGWHVIKVEDRRSETPRSFSEMREELRRKAGREVLDRRLVELRRNAKIELFPDATGKPQ